MIECFLIESKGLFILRTQYNGLAAHDDVIKWKHFLRYWPFVRGIPNGTCEFPSQRPVTRSFDVFFDLRLNKRLSEQSRPRDLRRHHTHYDVTALAGSTNNHSNDVDSLFPEYYVLITSSVDTIADILESRKWLLISSRGLWAHNMLVILLSCQFYDNITIG